MIIGSDKTNLTRFSGDKFAWPVYISVGNISKATRRKTSRNATILLGYLPVSKLSKILPSARSATQHQLFHNCMKILLQPLVKAGTNGVDMLCSDGEVRLVFLILSAYLADYPEQCLVACCKENRCPKCLVSPNERGDPVRSELRNTEATIEILQDAALGMDSTSRFEAHGLRPVDPFWRTLPHCDIFSTFTPDLLHQLHKGVFGDHVSKWTQQTVSLGDLEVDLCFKSMTGHPSLRHFQKGITLVSQWTGREYKELEKVFLGVVAGAADEAVISAVRSILDFIYYAHFESHTDSTLKKLQDAWTEFHEKKSVFVQHGIREHFNIPKFHSMQHYLHMIISHGTPDNFNTELPERLHIDIAKDAFDHSNKKDFIAQMCLRLQRHEAVRKFTSYLQQTVTDYIPGGKKRPVGQDVADDIVDNDDNENDDDLVTPCPPSATSISTSSQHPIDMASPLTTKLNTSPVSANPSLLAGSAALHHNVASKPPFHMSLDTINERFGINLFSKTLEKFLLEAGSLHPSLENTITNTRYPIFKQFTIKIPSPQQVSSEPFVRDVIRARSGEPGSTVLVKPNLSITDNTPIMWWDIRGGFRREIQ